MKTWVCTIFCLGLLITMAGSVEVAKTPAAGPDAAITKMARDYEAAFNKRDAAALGAMFAEDVDYTDENGVLVSGRDAVVNIFKKGFAMDPGAKMAIQVESVRSLTPDVAVERGTTLTTSREGQETPSAYTAIHVLKDGTWHIKQLVESPVPTPSPKEMLSDLGWMVGTWKEQDGEATIETKVNWAKGGNYLTRNFKVTANDQVTMEGWQIIGWNAAEKRIRSWLFDTEGGFEEGIWTRAGNDWSIRQSGVLPEGGRLASESILRRMGGDQCTWEMMNRTLDGDPQPNLPPIKMVRAKGK